MNVTMDKVPPGCFGISHGSGLAAELIRTGTQSWAGHAFLYLGNNVLVEGWPPVARLNPATTYDDALWAYEMWDALIDDGVMTQAQAAAAQALVVGRGHAQVGQHYDFQAYAAFMLEFQHFRKESQMDHFFQNDSNRVCSALVTDAEEFGGVPMHFVPEDGPGLDSGATQSMVPNLVSPGMLLGLAQRSRWL